MSKKINIMCEVNEDVYTRVVVPNKANKRFSRLISSLIQGYNDNSSIRAYIDSIMDGQREEQHSILDKLIEDMKQSMMNQGMCLDDARVIAQEGMDTFSSDNPEMGQSATTEEMGASIKDMVREETANIRDAISELQEQNKAILDAIRWLSSISNATHEPTLVKVERQQTPAAALEEVGSIPSMSTEEEPKREVAEEKPARKEPPKKKVEYHEDDIDDEEIIPLQEVENDTASTLDSQDLLKGLLEGNNYSF